MRNATYMKILVEKRSESADFDNLPRDLYVAEKHVADHLPKHPAGSANGNLGSLSKFASATDVAQEFVGCLQQ